MWVGRQFLGWSPASSWVGRPPVLGLVARQFLGWSPTSSGSENLRGEVFGAGEVFGVFEVFAGLGRFLPFAYRFLYVFARFCNGFGGLGAQTIVCVTFGEPCVLKPLYA